MTIPGWGRPKYGFMINSGNIDSMVAHYSVSLTRRNYDAYTAGGKPGKRPDRALTVYSKGNPADLRPGYADCHRWSGGVFAAVCPL